AGREQHVAWLKSSVQTNAIICSVGVINLFCTHENDLSQITGFIDVPRLNFRRVFPYTRHAPYPLESSDGGKKLLRAPIGEAPNSRLCKRRVKPFEFGNASGVTSPRFGAALRIVRRCQLRKAPTTRLRSSARL